MDNRYKTFRPEHEIYMRCNKKADELAEKFYEEKNCSEEIYQIEVEKDTINLRCI